MKKELQKPTSKKELKKVLSVEVATASTEGPGPLCRGEGEWTLSNMEGQAPALFPKGDS